MTLALTLIVTLGLGLPGPESREPIPLPAPQAKVEVEATPRPKPAGQTLKGRATWYAYRSGHAAAGPALRRALGKDWRGQQVDVCVGKTCTTVTLSDWCQCRKGKRLERLIDLDYRAFNDLAPTSVGVIWVRVKGL